jgi:hypothetical protein
MRLHKGQRRCQADQRLVPLESTTTSTTVRVEAQRCLGVIEPPIRGSALESEACNCAKVMDVRRQVR